MHKVFLAALILGSVLFGLQKSGSGAGQEKTVAGGATAQGSAAKVTITTGGGLYGPVKTQYKVGEDVPVVISLTNTTDAPLKYCLSTSIFQNRPQLKRDGQLLPYLSNLPAMADKEENVRRCESSAAREFYVLQPKQSRAVDAFTLMFEGANWYGTLQAGRYELALRRRIECCQGPFVESDKISFEVVP